MDLKSSHPFWAEKNGLINSYPSLREDLHCDVLVVGGGITGALIAHQCVGAGYDTVLIDKREIGHGSSSATTSMLQYEIDVPLYKLGEQIGVQQARASYTACAQAIDTLAKIAKEIESDAGFTPKESLYLAARKKDVSSLKREFSARRDAGFEVRWMEKDEVSAKFGIAAGHGGILSKKGASVDAFRLLHELLSYNENRGLRVYDRTALVEVAEAAQYNHCTLDTGAVIRTKKMVYCTGYESKYLIKENFVKLSSTYAIVSEVNRQAADKLSDILIWDTGSPYLYMRSTDDGRILIGGADEPFRNPLRRDALLEKKEANLRESFSRFFPETEFHTDFVWAGTFGHTKDGLPYIGPHKDFRNTYFVLGFGGNGITFSVVGMDMLSAWLTGEDHYLSGIFAFGR